MKTFAQMRDYIKPVLTGAGLTDVGQYPGPELPDVPSPFIVWTRYGGPGVELEGVSDARAWQARCVGPQMDYDSAEKIADTVDFALLSHNSSMVGDVWVTSIARVGGAPNPLLTDKADRTHFVCSYIVSVELALPY